jgi:hypothetical protein
VCGLLLLLQCHSAGILLAQPPSNGSGLFRSEVEGEILLLRVEFSQFMALGSVDDCEDAGYGFAEVVSAESIISFPWEA